MVYDLGVCVCLYLHVSLAQPCCGGGSCAFPACRGARVGVRRGDGEGEAPVDPGCGGSVGRGLLGGTLKQISFIYMNTHIHMNTILNDKSHNSPSYSGFI